MQQLNDLSNDFLSHDVNSYDNCAPISYHDNEPNTSVATPPSLYLHKFVYGPCMEFVGRCEESVTY